MPHLIDHEHETDYDGRGIDLDDVDVVEARVDAGDNLDPSLACSFAEHGPNSKPCPHESTGVRRLGEIDLSACAHHTAQGGFLHEAAHAAYGRAMVAKLNAEAAESAKRLGITATRHQQFPSHCSGCGCRLFTGNPAGLCSECYPVEEPAFPHKMDRHGYEDPSMPEWRIRNGIG